MTNYEQDAKRIEFLTTAARALFSQFRDDGQVDAKAFLLSAVAVFREYPDHVVASVSHPVTGIASKQNWRPTVFEIRKACDAASYSGAEKVDKAIAETLQRRREDEDRKVDPETRAAHVARLRAEGKLNFSGPEGDLRKPWWQRLTPSEAQATLDRYAGEAREQITGELYDEIRTASKEETALENSLAAIEDEMEAPARVARSAESPQR